MNQSKKIALCGVSAALGSIFLMLAIFAPTGRLSLFALSSVALMLPLSKNLYGGAAITVVATALIALISGGLLIFLPYILGFGIHPLVSAFFEKYKSRRAMIIKIILKALYFNIVLYILYSLAYLAELFAVDIKFYILALVATPIFIAYDFLMAALQKRVTYFLNRYIRF